MLRRAASLAAPAGIHDARRVVRLFRTGRLRGSWARAAVDPQIRRMVRASLLEFVPFDVLVDPKCVVDVGAHVGEWSAAVLELLRPELLIAIEPSPRSSAELVRRIGGREGTRILTCAAGAEKGTAKLNVFGAGDLDSVLPIRGEIERFYGHDVSRPEVVEVEVSTLDELLADEPEITLLKIDVQGGEAGVLAGAAATLRRTKAVLLETNFVSHYHGDTLFAELDTRMLAAGFSLFTFATPLHTDPATGRLLFADAVYASNASIASSMRPG